MSFLDHLEELRWHLVRSVAAILIFSVAAFVGVDFVFNTVIFGPAKVDFWTFRMLCKVGDLINSTAICIDELDFKIQSRKMTGQFSMHITSSFVVGIIVAFPYVFWEFWRFISPGLYSKERRASRGPCLLFPSCLPRVYSLATTSCHHWRLISWQATRSVISYGMSLTSPRMYRR